MKELIKYFVNLLILQFRNKPKAKATIETLAEQTFSDSQGNIFPVEVQGAYSLDTAVGKQLDVIGKYIGYDRVLKFPVNNDFRYEEYDGSINPEQGYSEYFQDKDTFPYAEYRYTSYDYYNVTDDTYRKILKMISLLKNKPLSLGCIDEVLEEVFEGLIYVEEGDKSIEYHIAADLYSALNTQDKLNQFFQKYFPRPMGCTMTVVRDPFYLNLQTIGGAEDYIDENFVYTRETQSNTTYLKTFKGFDVSLYEDFEIQVKVKFDSSYTSCDFYYTAIDGNNTDNDKKYDFGLEKRRLTSSFALINKNNQGQVQYIDIVGYNNYVNDWVTLKLKREGGETVSGSLVLTIIVNGETVDTVDSYWRMAVLENAYFIFGSDLIGSIDFKECWIKQKNVMTWKGITNKKPKGV